MRYALLCPVKMLLKTAELTGNLKKTASIAGNNSQQEN